MAIPVQDQGRRPRPRDHRHLAARRLIASLVAPESLLRALRDTFDATPKGFMKVLLPLLIPMIKRDVAKQHANFKEFCEAQTS